MRKMFLLLVMFFITGVVQAGVIEAYLDDYNDQQHYKVTVENDTTVTLWSTSFDNGNHIDPMGIFYDENGDLLSYNDDNRFVDYSNQTYWDFGLSQFLQEGEEYTFVLAIYDSFPLGNLSDGFRSNYHGDASFPDDEYGYYNIHYTDGISLTSISAIPEPTGLALVGLGLAGIGFTRIRPKVK